MRRSVKMTICLLLGLTTCLAQADDLDLSTINRIVYEGLYHSEIPQTAAYLTDRIGGRLTNSPQMREAERWTQEKFRGWGLSDVRAEGFEFGRGWSYDNVGVRMLTPRLKVLRAIPVAWTPGTPGVVRGQVIVAPLAKERDFERWRGQLRGKVVMVERPQPAPDTAEPVFKRFSNEELAQMDTYPQPHHSVADYARRVKRAALEGKRDAFLAAEGALVWVAPSDFEGGLLAGHGYGYAMTGFRVGQTPKVPGIELAAEDYRQLARLAKAGDVPTLELTSEVHFHEDDTQAYNILADLPGRDPKAGYVLAGAHLDSWVASDGAADNAAGSVVVMEAARILAKLKVRPKRGIRFALWNAEEPGLLGSLAYVDRHLASRTPLGDAQIEGLNPYFSRSWFNRWPVTPKPGHAVLSAYFNVDSGSGKVRGLYAEGNLAAAPVLKRWLEPFASMGVDRVVAQGTGGSDHLGFGAVGVPAFELLQDPLDYHSRIHHSSIDSYDHLSITDLKQTAVVLASVLLSAANAEQPLPRMPVPTPPAATDPFEYDAGDD